MANNFTERESEIMAKTWLCVKEVPKIDYNDLANMCGFNNPRSASNAWSNIRKKLDAMADNIPTSTAEAAAGKATPKKRGKDEQADGGAGSPTKKPRGKGAAKKKVVKKQDEDGVNVKKESVDGSEEDESSMI